MLFLLDKAWGFGSEAIPAPQATLMKMIVEGVMNENLPWALVFIGAFIAISLEIIGISALPVAIGLYLPLELTSTIMIGGLIRLVIDKKKANTDESENVDASNGILFCSGMIAGEGLVGILLAIFAVAGIESYINISNIFTTGQIGGLIAIILMIVFVWKFANSNKGHN